MRAAVGSRFQRWRVERLETVDARTHRALSATSRGKLWWTSRNSGLLPVSSHDVQGQSASPDRWTYTLTLPAPSTSITKRASSDTVLHLRIGATMARPWAGKSPIENAAGSRKVLEQVERNLHEEHAGPVGSILPVPDPAGSQPVIDEVAVLRGRAIGAEASEVGLAGRGPSRAYDVETQPRRPATVADVRHRPARRGAVAVRRGRCSVELVTPGAGADTREAWRRFLHATVAPIAATVSAELARLGLDSKIDYSGLNASDLAGRSRAYKQLIEAGVKEDEARRICGFG